MVAPPPPPQLHPLLPLKVNFIVFNFLLSARSHQKTFNVTFPIELVNTLFFYKTNWITLCYLSYLHKDM